MMMEKNKELIARLRNGLENVMRPAVTGGERAAWLRSNGPDLFIILAALQSRPAPTEERVGFREWLAFQLEVERNAPTGLTAAQRLLDVLERYDATETQPVAGGEQIPAGMKPWHGGERAPEDWDDGKVLWRDGSLLHCSGPRSDRWRHHGKHPEQDIIAYTPKPTTPERANALEEALAEIDRIIDVYRSSGVDECLASVPDLRFVRAKIAALSASLPEVTNE